MKTADFDFELPPELIAQHPAARRERSRMLVVRRQAGTLEHRHFSDLPRYLDKGDLLVVNNTRVIPARVFGQKPGTGGKVEILLLEEIRPGTWDILLRASRRPKIGSLITLGHGQAVASLLSDGEKGRATIKIESERPWLEVLEEIGMPPLPPYIRRSKIGDRKSDAERYQTVYAKHPGAVAAPTAGLHFTDEIFKTLETQGVKKAEVTLHVGLGTFRPVDAENVEDHRMEAERYTLPAETAKRIGEAKAGSGRIVAVGSTTVRTLETVAAEHGLAIPCSGRSSLFIHPPYSFKVVDAMLTNFHLPKSTPIMMVCALAARYGSPRAGRDLVMRAYSEAVARKYRFYSYGDCMLIV
jgi:S-adenosylmethionine:tRNA ribosyltransferase-isomerase